MQSIENPNKRLTMVFGVITVISAVVTLAGFAAGGDNGILVGIVAAIVLLTGSITTPLLWMTGQKQIREIQALITGEQLLAHWSYSTDEWRQYTENELARGMKQTRTVSLWTAGICLALFVGTAFFVGGVNGAYIVIAVVATAGMTALLGGTLYLSAKSAHAANRDGVGEVFVGQTAAYFGNRLYTWKGRYATLRKVEFEPGDPGVVQIDYQVGSGDQASYVEVRVPVPRGREAEAQDLVDWFHRAS